MKSRRSYLDNINAGRSRRHASEEPLTQINKTLDELEERLDRARDRRGPRSDEDEIAQRIQQLSDSVSRSRPRPVRRAAAPAQGSRATLERAAQELERVRRQEYEAATINGLADELKTLREDLRSSMHSGLRGEFEALRRDLAKIMASVPNAALSGEMVVEFERLSNAIAHLAERSDDKNVKMLRLELEELKGSIAALAREDTLHALDRRWGDFDDRWNAFEHRVSAKLDANDPAIDMLHRRIEEIGSAVNSLPESLSLHSLEDRVRTLATALDQLLDRRSSGDPELYSVIDERLDEISRAIAALGPVTQTASLDPQPFERIEARISSLASQVAEVLADRPGEEAVGRLSEQLSELSTRVDEIAGRIDFPDQTVERLADQIAVIAEKLDATPNTPANDQFLRGLEDQFARLTEAIDKRQGDALNEGRILVQDLEQRLQDMAARLDERAAGVSGDPALMATIDARFNELTARLENSLAEPVDGGALRAMEARLDDIASRLQTSSSQVSSVDADVIQNLEAQVKSLSEHLSRPGPDVPEFEDIAPRLESIERSISENRTAVIEAARQAAAHAMGALETAPHKSGDDERLRDELKALEALTRKSDERNSKTFEAIHDTLLKIVDRLGTVENAAKTQGQAPTGKIAVEAPPSIEPDAFDEAPAEEAAEEVRAEEAYRNRSPAAAAAAAARAALDEDEEVQQAKPGRTSLLGGLSRALAGRKEKQPAGGRADPEVEAVIDDTVEIDVERVNEPLEPGSGTPDLNAIMRRVRDEKKAPARDGNEAAKSDFIAAARRAAQAAAAEAEILKKRQSQDADASGRFGLNKLLKRTKKPLVVVLGAGLVAAGGLQLSKALLSDTASILPQLQSWYSPADNGAAPAGATPPKTVAEREQTATVRPARVVDNTARQSGQAVDLLAEMPETADSVASLDTAKKFDTRLAENGQSPVIPAAGDAITVGAPMTVSMALDEVPLEAGPLPLREAAAEGDAKALFEIGNRYLEGRSVDADAAKALQWYSKAADAGYAPAQYRLGDLYQKGRGTERDLTAAKNWFQRAAGQGNVSAMHNLGVLFAMGADGPADNAAAARWFVRAAEHGVKDSQFNLGILSAKGMGMSKNLSEAYKWFSLVADAGDSDAAAKRDEVAAVLDAEQLRQAKDRTALWKAKPIQEAANTVDIPDAWRESREMTAGIDMKKAITNVQLILNNAGFDAGTPDGVMGSKTKSAIMAFQKANGMAPSGEIDEALVRALLERNETAGTAN